MAGGGSLRDMTIELPRPADTTLGELRASGWRPRSVKEEMRANLLAHLREGRTILPGILGYDDSVLPQLENAILAGQDVILLGERGQAKSRIARNLVGLLDPWLPYLAGTELHDDPMHPVSPLAKGIVADEGDAAPVGWWAAEDRYSEKLATPDISIADLIGEVDPVKVAEGRYLSDELTIHYGLLPRTHRGIFSLNELPDLAERIQVGLLNVMEERDVQVRGYRVRLELDLFVIASANPEDYTSRGRIITPLKDRFGAQIRTHYPEESDTEMAIVDAEATAFDTDEDRSIPVQVPGFMKEVVAELSQLARRSSEVSQRSGVSVRVTIANHETLAAAALKRAVRLDEPAAAPRISDLPAVVASTAGKIELETLGDETREDRVVEKLVARAVVNVFNRHFALSELAPLIDRFEEEGLQAEVGEFVPSSAHGAARRRGPRAARGSRSARCRGVAGGARVVDRVRPRGAAPQPTAEQGASRRRHPLRALTRDRHHGLARPVSARSVHRAPPSPARATRAWPGISPATSGCRGRAGRRSSPGPRTSSRPSTSCRESSRWPDSSTTPSSSSSPSGSRWRDCRSRTGRPRSPKPGWIRRRSTTTCGRSVRRTHGSGGRARGSPGGPREPLGAGAHGSAGA